MALDFFQAVLCGAIKALGQQKAAAYINMVTYYVFAIPIAYILAFDKTPWVKGRGQKGLWTGCIVGMIHQGIMYLLLLSVKVNWHEECENASNRRKLEIPKTEMVEIVN